MFSNIKAVLFDLDGTLADTAPDLAYALNATLIHYGKTPLSLEQIRPEVSHGGIALIRLGFNIEPDTPGFEEKRQYLLDVYKNNICRDTRLFPGMEEVLNTLEANQIRWGIVTNKPGWLTDPLMSAMQITERTPCIVSGDTCEHNKPHPQPIHYACELLAVTPEQAITIGDAGRDIEAGKAAGTKTIGALFGYLQKADPAESWQADEYIKDALALLPLLGL